MGRRLYVGNLAWTVTDQDLQEAFSEAGAVDSSQVIIDRATNRSRGFGFVEMASDDAAEAAIKNLNGRDLKGRPIRVNEAQARSNDRGARPAQRDR
ncbi:MAG: RNA recognition motif domain-containing protein [Candidatus Binataceae bacterium]